MCSLLGKCADLKGAYKQFARSTAHGHLSIITVWDPIAGRARYFEAQALMFGESAAVYGFNRCARALEALMVKMFAVPTANFFDDFPMVDFAGIAHDSARTVEALGELLGWVWKDPVAEAAKKREREAAAPKEALEDDDEDDMAEDRITLTEDGSPQPVFVALGVLVDLRQSGDGVLRMRNKPGRVKAILKDLRRSEQKGHIIPAEADAYLGRLRYTGSNAFGRIGAKALRGLSEIVGGRAARPIADGDGGWLLAEMRKVLRSTAPRDVSLKGGRRTPAVILTDGACEEDGEDVSVGGVLIPSDRSRPRWFFWEVPRRLLEHWRGFLSKDQVIHEAELLPAAISRRLWSDRLRGELILHFIDQDAARLNLIRGYARSMAGAEIIDRFWEAEREVDGSTWIDRVQTDANMGDPASRGELATMGAFGDRDMVDDSIVDWLIGGVA